MFISAYETTPCRDYQLDTIKFGIQKAMLSYPEAISKPIGQRDFKATINVITPQIDDITSFGHPFILVESHGKVDEYARVKSKIDPSNSYKWCAVDARNCTRVDRDGKVSVTSTLDYSLMLMRAAISIHCARYDANDLLGLTNFPLTVYTRWLTEQLTRRFALSPETQLKTTVIVAYYYLSQFQIGNPEEKDYLRMGGQIAKATYIPIESVLNIIEKIGLLSTCGDLTNALQTHGDSIRFEKFTPAVLYSVIAGSWFGFNSRENVAVAVEHPPTFIAMLYMAVNERGYRNTILGKLAKENNRGDIANFFIKSVDSLVYQDN